MPTIDVQLRRFSLVSHRQFDEIVTMLLATIGRPDVDAFREAMAAAGGGAALAEVVQKAVGSSELMEFARFDIGQVLRQEQDEHAPQSLRLVVGNPLIMMEMVTSVPDAASYAPVTILVDERTDGVHLSYDSMESLLAPYGSLSALAVARELDAKIVRLLDEAAH